METITEKANCLAKVENNEFAYVEAMLADGTPVKVAKQTLADLINAQIENSAAYNDGVYILYHKKSSGSAMLSQIGEWKDAESRGETADGVAISTNNGYLVIAQTEQSGLKWSTEPVAGGGTTTTSSYAARSDFKGEDNTNKDVLVAACQGIDSAVGYCHQFSCGGIASGQWWLPSAGELNLIADKLNAVNNALGLLKGASPIQRGGYWSSTESSVNGAWQVIMSNHAMFNDSKVKATAPVRPVTYLKE